MISSTVGLVLLSLASSILAKTDLAGCTSTRAATGIVYWVPESGEICQLLDCGGGRAPPKTDVPGCAAYEGSAPYQPSFLPGFGGTVTASSETVPTSGLLTDTSVLSTPAAAASTTLATSTATLADTTSTLQTGAAVTGLSTSGLLFDTSATTRDATNVISITSAITSASAGPATATANAAPDRMHNQKLAVAFIGVAAGFALI